jgi:SAM-dependent methyltransferase
MDATVYFLEPDAWSDAWPDNDVTALDLVGGRVLNVGAGAGRFLLALQSRGHEPMALDVSPGAVEVCRRRGVRRTILGPIEELADTDPLSLMPPSSWATTRACSASQSDPVRCSTLSAAYSVQVESSLARASIHMAPGIRSILPITGRTVNEDNSPATSASASGTKLSLETASTGT